MQSEFLARVQKIVETAGAKPGNRDWLRSSLDGIHRIAQAESNRLHANEEVAARGQEASGPYIPSPYQTCVREVLKESLIHSTANPNLMELEGRLARIRQAISC